MKKRTKIAIICVLILAVLVGTTSVALAANLGTLKSWEANYTGDGNRTDQIGRWGAKSLTVRTFKLNSDASFSFLIGVDHAIRQWKTPLNISITASSTASYGDIEFFGGTREEIKSYTGYVLPENVTGQTRYYYIYNEGTWTYKDEDKTGYIYSYIYCYLIDNGGTNECNTATHELGHALGWMGHSTNRNCIMSPSVSSVTDLQESEKNHLSQVYD